jgi:hypothetical protein
MASALRGATRLACENDDVSMLSEQLQKATSAASPENLQRVLQTCVRDAAWNNSTKVVACLIDHGADVAQITARTLVDTINDTLPSLEMLNLLAKYDWDVNNRNPGPRDDPLLWYVVRDTELVKWCLDHGAVVDVEDDTPPGVRQRRKPILECAAVSSSIEAFEVLRASGAPVSYSHGILPSAVMAISLHLPLTDEDSGSECYKRLMTMIRHLVDVVGCDVNSASYGSYYGSGSTCSTPLCWIACHKHRGARELVRFLLDRGGDVDLAGPREDGLEIPSARMAAMRGHNSYFLDLVAEWKAEQKSCASENTK